jgi:LysM repeat protein
MESGRGDGMNNAATARSHDSLTRGQVPTRRTARGPGPVHVSTMEIVILVMIGLLLVTGVLATRSSAAVPTSTGVVRVEPGDTLWSIAKAHPVSGLSTAQGAELIAALNHMSNDPLSVGVSLVVPVTRERGLEFASR